MRKKLVIIGAVAVAVAAGGGFAAWKMLSSKPAEAGSGAAVAEPAPAEEGEKAADGHGSGEGESATGGNVGNFVEVGPIYLPILGKRGIEQNISVTVVIEVDGKEASDKVEKLKPRLADALINDLYGALRSPASGRELIDISAIKGRIEKKAQEVLGEGIVKDVLFKNVSQVPL